MSNRSRAVEGLKAVAQRNNSARARAVATLIRATGSVEQIRRFENKNGKTGD